MKIMDNEDLERRIGRAVSSLDQDSADMADQLWETPVEKAAGGEWYLKAARPERRNRRPVFRYMAAAAAMLLVVILAFQLRRPVIAAPDARIYLDVNPSLTIEVDKDEKVMNVTADNADGELILEGMDLKNVDVDVAINALIGSMVKNGYLSEAKNFILMTVEGNDPEKTEALRARLENAIDQSMQSMIGSSAVFDQVADIDDDTIDLAEQYDITPGKAFLIGQLTEADPQLDYDTLAGMTIAQLYDYLKTEGVDLRSILNYHGIDLDEDDDPAEELIDELEDKYEDVSGIDDADDIDEPDDDDWDDDDDDFDGDDDDNDD